MIAELLSSLVAADSVNPEFGGGGEAAAGAVASEWMQANGLAVEVVEVAPARPNVIGRTGGDGPAVLLLGHLDTVGVAGMEAPFVPRVEDGRLYGRGTYDMKAGLAAAMVAAARCASANVIVAAVCDEEAGALGTRALLESGLRADAAIVTEPTDLDVCIAHKGYVGFTIETAGRAAHGSRPDLGVDAILAMAPVMERLAALDAALQSGPAHPLLGAPSLHASLISGGQEFSSYPASCVLEGEVRTVPGLEVEPLLRAAAGEASLRIGHVGECLSTPRAAPVVGALEPFAGAVRGIAFWTDAALLSAAGIPSVLFGPAGGGAHAVDEWVDLASVDRVVEGLVGAIRTLSAPDPERPRQDSNLRPAA